MTGSAHSFSTPEKEEYLLKITDSATSMDLLEELELAMDVLNEAMNSLFYTRLPVLQGLGKLREAGVGENSAMSRHFLLRGSPHNVRRQSELENTGHDVFSRSDIDHFCDRARTFIETGSHLHMIYSALQFSSWCNKL